MSSIQIATVLLASNVPLPASLLLAAPAPVAAPPILAWGELVFLATFAFAYGRQSRSVAEPATPLT